jgi:hypothetical protein
MSTNPSNNPINLWNNEVDRINYGSQEQYNEHLLQQYKIYLEMADRTSARRNLANTFFLTLNTLVLGVAGYSYEKGPSVPNPWFNFFPFLFGLGLCGTWFVLILSYRQLNKAKFEVVGEYERRLPSSPFWNAEWALLGEGKNFGKYIPLSIVEQIVPIAFAAMYLLIFLGLVFFG